MKLRPYQNDSISQIIKAFNEGNRKVLLHLDTGAGKTTVFATLLKEVFKKKYRAIMIVKGRKLVDQASQRLEREFVPHGVFMANHKKFDDLQSIQACSIDTLTRRKVYPPAFLIVIDEAHLALSQSYRDFLEHYPNAFILAVTATPYCTGAMDHIADVIIRPIKFNELVEQGFLVPPIYYGADSPDLSEAKIVDTPYGKDYSFNDSEKIMNNNFLVSSIPKHYKKFCNDLPAICFCTSVKHSERTATSFINAGIPAYHLDANSNDEQRNQALMMLEKGRIKVITNCGILSLGVDIPCCRAVILARPTQSLNLYIQQVGRGTRTYLNKVGFIVLDLAGNVPRHGFVEWERDVTIAKQKFKKLKVPACHTCPHCYIVFEGKNCPKCNYELVPVKTREQIEIETELKKLSYDPRLQEAYLRKTQLAKISKAKGYKAGWIYHQIKNEFGSKIAKFFYPNFWRFGRAR